MNATGPLVSILIPTYNYGAYLADAIDSVLAQTVSDYEIVVVDDGSTDDTAEIAARYPQVRYLRQENAGVGAARERGRLAARGRYLAFIDADDLWHPRKLEKQLAYLEAHPDCRIVFTLFENFYERPELERDPVAKQIHDIVFRQYMASCLMDASLFGEFGGFDTSMRSGEDTVFITKLTVHQVDTSCCLDEVLYYRRLHGANLTLHNGVADDRKMLAIIARALREKRGGKRVPAPQSGGETGGKEDGTD